MPSPGPNGGVVNSLDEAKAAFRAARIYGSAQVILSSRDQFVSGGMYSHSVGLLLKSGLPLRTTVALNTRIIFFGAVNLIKYTGKRIDITNVCNLLCRNPRDHRVLIDALLHKSEWRSVMGNYFLGCGVQDFAALNGYLFKVRL